VFRRIWSVTKARAREFYRDRASLSWNFVFPVLIVIGFYFIFSNDNPTIYKVGYYSAPHAKVTKEQVAFFQTKFIEFIATDKEKGLNNVRKHKFDMLIALDNSVQFWINSSSKNGYFLEKVLRGSDLKSDVIKGSVEGKEVNYVDWVFPGILAMNVMFSCLWGVGYVLVKYRQDGYLKRLRATPLRAFEFLLNQVLARYVISLFVTSIVFFGCKIFIGFEMQGSYLDLFIVFSAGVFCLISIGLLVACRTTSKEFSDGILNIVSWPMMFLSGVWFSLEGSNEIMILLSKLLPLTHMVDAGRQIMIEGATLTDVWLNVVVLIAMSFVLLVLSSIMFKWTEE